MPDSFPDHRASMGATLGTNGRLALYHALHSAHREPDFPAIIESMVWPLPPARVGAPRDAEQLEDLVL